MSAVDEYRKQREVLRQRGLSPSSLTSNLADAAIIELESDNDRLHVCGTCARCRAPGVCQGDWPVREYSTAHAPDCGLHSECWRGGALGWVAYWVDPEEEKQNVMADMEATGYKP